MNHNFVPIGKPFLMYSSATVWLLHARLVGKSNWNEQAITVYMEDATLPASRSAAAKLLEVLGHHVTTLVQHLFLHVKPPKPAQSRWTGVPAVSQWCLALSLFHRLFVPLMKALSEKDSGNSSLPTTLDGDVGIQVAVSVWGGSQSSVNTLTPHIIFGAFSCVLCTVVLLPVFFWGGGSGANFRFRCLSGTAEDTTASTLPMVPNLAPVLNEQL